MGANNKFFRNASGEWGSKARKQDKFKVNTRINEDLKEQLDEFERGPDCCNPCEGDDMSILGNDEAAGRLYGMEDLAWDTYEQSFKDPYQEALDIGYPMNNPSVGFTVNPKNLSCDVCIGYHKRKITKGTLGQVSKIKEELEELEDAVEQKALVMELCELADLYGAIEAYVDRHHPTVGMEQIIKMSDLTKAAFKAGQRK